MTMSSSCCSIDCVDTKEGVVIRMRSAKPEWQKSQASFIRNFFLEKERLEKERLLPSIPFSPSAPKSPLSISSSPSSSSSFPARLGTHLPGKGEGRFLPPVGLVEVVDHSGCLDAYVLRQKYVRSYQFTRPEDHPGSSHKVRALKKIARNLVFPSQKKQGTNGKGNANREAKLKDSLGTCFKHFFFSCVTKVGTV